MPITKTTGYKASDGQTDRFYATVEEAVEAEVKRIMINVFGSAPTLSDAVVTATEGIIEHADELIAALTTGPRSRPSTRKKAGTTAPRRARARAATATEAASGFKAMREAVDPDDATLSRTCLRGGADTEVALETGR